MTHYIIISIIEMSCNIILQRVHYLNLIQIRVILCFTQQQKCNAEIKSAHFMCRSIKD